MMVAVSLSFRLLRSCFISDCHVKLCDGTIMMGKDK
jgi:hypothetical protein